MVEKNTNATTQLPISAQGDKILMHGSIADLKQHLKNEMDEVPMNELENLMLDKFLSEPQDCADKVAELLNKVKNRLHEQKRAVRQLNKVIPLFEKHEFWSTQPVMRVNEAITQFNEQIDNRVLADIDKNPLPLPESYEWGLVDMKDPNQAQEIYDLLTNHYVEDDGGNFRFDYSVEFLTWALTPPGYKKDWLVGVRGGKAKRLYGFISGIPVNITTQGKTQVMAEINFLCVHK